MDMTKKLIIDNNLNTFEDAFFIGQYNLTIREVSTLLDMSERYVYDYLKIHFDYISVTKKQTYVFLPEHIDIDNSYKKVYDKAMTILQAGRTENDNPYRTVTVGDYYDRLVRRRIFINRPNFRQYLLRDLKEVVVNPTTGKEEYKKIQKWQVDHLLKGTAKLYSLSTLRTRWMLTHNMQVYRRIKGMKDVTKVALISNSTDKPMIRYLIPISAQLY